ncbi:acyl-CoA dehydrogenase family protein [Candidatus Poriferisocius sp.]|uniref:acyl-CoA dehydrogenase family protein n=1 Tax=Candidatus Poriferisocius sp. TaxID=3101276 RepID=UPI003B02E724
MDFTLTEEQQAVADLANRIMGDRIDMERLAAVETAGGWFDRDVYGELAAAGLVGIALGTDVGGGGLDLIAAGQVLEAQGRHVAPVPLWSGMLAAMAVDDFGTPEQRRRELPGCADGSNVLTVGLQEYLNDDVANPMARVVGGKLVGTKEVVEFAAESSRIVVVAGLDDGTDNGTISGTGLFMADLSDPAVTMEAGISTRHQPVHQVSFYGAPCEPLGPADGASARWLADWAVALLCATQVGVVDRALRLAAEYTSEREQFGRPVATFQAVTQRLADQFMHVEAVRLCTYAALYDLANGNDASLRLPIAKWYASHWAHDVAHATQHVHGGMGVSIDYPLHRYTLWNKHIECSLGAGTQQLRTLGARLAAG